MKLRKDYGLRTHKCKFCGDYYVSKRNKDYHEKRCVKKPL